MATHSSTLAWKIPWTEEPGRLPSMGLWRVGHDWATSLSLFTFMHWRRKWQHTPVFLPGESQGWGSLVGCHLWTWLKWLSSSSFCLCPFSGEVFFFLIINGCWNTSKLFLYLLRLSEGFYLSNYLYSVLHWLICIHQNPCIPGINPTGSWFMIIFLLLDSIC